jgi:predicted nucleotidyltransferase
MPEALDPVPLLKHLHEHGVEHIVIGGVAVSAHGHVRTSKDLDVVPNPVHENLERLAAALAEINAVNEEASDFDPEELPMSSTRVEDLSQGGNFCLATDLGRLDIFQWVKGIEADDLYAALHPEALAGNVDGIPVRVCGLEHLLAMKRAAGRPQDLEDLKRLGGGADTHEPVTEDTPGG